MTHNDKKHFLVAELADGRFVAASQESPYFCFRDVSEEAVLDKVKNALVFYAQSEGHGNGVRIKPVTRSITTLGTSKKVLLDDYMPKEAA